MAKPYQVWVFGKAGCDKCKVMNKRVDGLLAKPAWQDVEKVYWDVETVDGLLAFCNAECVNPQRVPALLVMRRNEVSGKYEPVPNSHPGSSDPVCKGSKLYMHVGLQTDYTSLGKGIISPKMLTSVLKEGISAA